MSAIKILALSILLATLFVPDKGATARPVIKVPGQGGNGTAFDDVRNITGATIINIQSISIVSYYQVDSIEVTYLLSNGSLYKAPKHGDVDFSFPEIINLDPDEFVEKIEGKTDGKVIDQLTITTRIPKDDGRIVYGPYGMTNASHNFAFEGFIIGFHGRSGSIMDQIGVYKLAPVTKSKQYGIPYFAAEFDDNPDVLFPPVVGIKTLFIHHGGQVNSIQAEYQLFGGGTKLSEKHGTPANTLSVLRFGHREQIVEMRGELDYKKRFLNQLSFVTKKPNGRVKVHGPFGTAGSEPFSVRGSVIGFAGNASNFVQAISVYYYT